VIEVRVPAAADVPCKLAEVQTNRQRRLVTVGVTHGTQRLAEAVRVLDSEQVRSRSCRSAAPTLDEILLSLTGKRTIANAPNGARAVGMEV